MSKQHQEIALSDYKAPDFDIQSIDLEIDLFEKGANVKNTMNIKRAEGVSIDAPLILNGVELEILGVRVNGELKDFTSDDQSLTLNELPLEFILEIETKTSPELNTSCEGLYKSGTIFCTQCESQGFRKITYYLDRPDVMSIFTTTITAESKYPYLLSNGNKVDSGRLEGGRHWAKWHDPFKKPSYLFALVAGDLALVQDTFTTKSGRDVALEIFVDHGNEDRCTHAMESLKNSMKWDEDKFGLEYDLDIYMIVAVDSFNMGAMENKGLNIFNSVYVLAKQETAVDEEYLGIESVIGHEYFHNWTGNRVTCRDWFQLTLKEGLTVFRDQEFSADMFDRDVQRMMDVTRLKEGQFPEDAGPMAHPIKPKSYVEINNFYTATIYEKGAEVIRMIHTLIGADNFRKGMDKYFELFDGQAVRTQDFVYAMELASGKRLSQFQRWYDFAGTPTLNIQTQLKTQPTSNTKSLSIHIKQEIPKQGNEKLTLKPLHIPFAFSVDNKSYIHEISEWDNTITIELDEPVMSDKAPVCEWNLNFSAPVNIKDDLGISNLVNIIETSKNSFSKWSAFQELIFKTLANDFEISELAKLLNLVVTSEMPEAVKAKFLCFPSEVQLSSSMKILYPQAIIEFKNTFTRYFARTYGEQLVNLYTQAHESSFNLTATAMGKRSLRKQCLSYMASSDNSKVQDIVWKHYQDSTNMTDQYGSLQALVQSSHKKSEEALEMFYKQWKQDNLVINKWLSLQSMRKDGDFMARLEKVSQDEVFDFKEPNKLRALYGTFAMRNLSSFHTSSGQGYDLTCQVIEKLDTANPQVGARIAKAFRDCIKLPDDSRKVVEHKLTELMKKLKSSDCTEVIQKTLDAISM